MQRLVAYDSEEESPERRRSRDELHLVQMRDGEGNDGSQSQSASAQKEAAKKVRKNSERWTASGDESSHESSSDATSSSSDSDSERMQPPPPKRYSPANSEQSVRSDVGLSSFRPTASASSFSRLPITQSQSSLVAYASQNEEEEDQFAKADKKAVELKPVVDHGDRSRSVTVEPKPPRGHEDSRSPDEIAVDSALEEGLRQLAHSTYQDGRLIGSMTPRSFEGNDSPFQGEEEEVKLPPSPAEKCSQEAEERFRTYFARKAAGVDLNMTIQNRQDFKNPSMYEKLIEAAGLDELGSNFAPSVFDPHGFTKDCFYEQISAMQKEVMEKYTAASEKKPASQAAKTEQPKSGDTKRKSRFETNKKH